ncbi:MAG TPA: hypothetical protein VD905_16200 [Flavobacteriales bacterium]|nr:hypothetical protein [Flavobacteriales bacterium]
MIHKLKIFAYLLLMLTFLSVIAGCHTQYQASGSSVRFLRGAKYFHCGTGTAYRRHVLATVYTGDPYLQRQHFIKSHQSPTVEQTAHYLAGFRAEGFFHSGLFRGTGLGTEYSQSKFTSNYTYPWQDHEILYQYKLMQHRLNVNLSFVMLNRSYIKGYISLQPGYTWNRERLHYETLNTRMTHSSFSKNFSFRAAWGFHFYIRSRMEINLELGYGAGSYGRFGVGVWVF